MARPSTLEPRQHGDSGSARLEIPNRPATPLFQGAKGKQRTEISFDPATDLVTLKMLVQDPNGYFIPNIRRENFVVYENGARQENATVDIEHAPVSVGILLEHGGRYEALDNAVADEVGQAARAFLDEIGKNDKVAIWKYGNSVENVSDFSSERDTLRSALDSLGTPSFSELNFHDAIMAALGRMAPVKGRKALLAISTGLDTFSKATAQDALRAAANSGTPVYVVNIGPAVRDRLSFPGGGGPYARLDWKGAGTTLQEIARASGGRMYSPQSTVELAGIYDDLMENLRVRYVITYKSTAGDKATSERNVRVELIDPKTGGPLAIVDESGNPIRSKLYFEARYTPAGNQTAEVKTPKSAIQP